MARSATANTVRVAGVNALAVSLSATVELRFFGALGPAFAAQLEARQNGTDDGAPRYSVTQASELSADPAAAFLSALAPVAPPAPLTTTTNIWTSTRPTVAIANAVGGRLTPELYQPSGLVVVTVGITHGLPATNPVVRWGIDNDRSQTANLLPPEERAALPEDGELWTATFTLPDVDGDNEFGLVVDFDDAFLSATTSSAEVTATVSDAAAPVARFADTTTIILSEGESSTLTVNLDAPARPGDSVLLQFTPVGGGAPSEDFDGDGVLAFAAGETSGEYNLRALSDGLDEGTEGLEVSITVTSPSGITSDADRRRTVQVNDPTVNFEATSEVALVEGGAAVTLAATMSAPAFGTETATVLVTGPPELADLGGQPIVFAFASGQTRAEVMVAAPDDSVAEGSEIGALELEANPFGVNRGSDFSRTLSIADASSGGNTPPEAFDLRWTQGQSDFRPFAYIGSDAEGDPLTFRVITPPTIGSIQDLSGPTYLAGFTGTPPFTDTFTYVANDGNADSQPATVTVNVVADGDMSDGKLLGDFRPVAPYSVVASADPVRLEYAAPMLVNPPSATVTPISATGTLDVSGFPDVFYTGTGNASEDRFLVAVTVGSQTVDLVFEVNAVELDWPGDFVDIDPGSRSSAPINSRFVSGNVVAYASRGPFGTGDVGVVRVSLSSGTVSNFIATTEEASVEAVVQDRALIRVDQQIEDEILWIDFESGGQLSSEPISVPFASRGFRDFTVIPSVSTVVFRNDVFSRDSNAVLSVAVDSDTARAAVSFTDPEGLNGRLEILGTVDTTRFIIYGFNSVDGISAAVRGYWLANYGTTGAESLGLITTDDVSQPNINWSTQDTSRVVLGDFNRAAINVVTASSVTSLLLEPVSGNSAAPLALMHGELSNGTWIASTFSGGVNLYTWSGNSLEAPISEEATVPFSSGYSPGVISGDRFFFRHSSPETGAELGVFDGTNFEVIDIVPGSIGSTPVQMIPLRPGVIAFVADAPDTGLELYVSDGTVAGTLLVGDVNPGPADSAPTDLAYQAGLRQVVATMFFPPVGSELFFFNLDDVLD